jgi:hypothetical protein
MANVVYEFDTVLMMNNLFAEPNAMIFLRLWAVRVRSEILIVSMVLIVNDRSTQSSSKSQQLILICRAVFGECR